MPNGDKKQKSIFQELPQEKVSGFQEIETPIQEDEGFPNPFAFIKRNLESFLTRGPPALGRALEPPIDILGEILGTPLRTPGGMEELREARRPPISEEERERFEQEQRVIDLNTRVVQAINTFAPDATSVSSQPLVRFIQPVIEDPDRPPLTLDDVINFRLNQRNLGIEVLGIARNEIRARNPLLQPIKKGPISNLVGGTTDLVRSFTKHPLEMVNGLILFAPLTIMNTIRETIQTTALPDNEKIQMAREMLVNLMGEMSPEEIEEARRSMNGLAAGIIAAVVFKDVTRAPLAILTSVGRRVASLTPRNLSRLTPAMRSLVEARAGIPSTTLSPRLKRMVGGGIGFGAFGAGTSEHVDQTIDNFITFSLASIPIGMTFKALNVLGRETFRITDPNRAYETSRNRSARPFDQESGPVPRFEDTGAIPLGERFGEARERLFERSPEILEDQGIRLIDSAEKQKLIDSVEGGELAEALEGISVRELDVLLREAGTTGSSHRGGDAGAFIDLLREFRGRDPRLRQEEVFEEIIPERREGERREEVERRITTTKPAITGELRPLEQIRDPQFAQEDLSNITPRLFRETSPERALELLPKGNVVAEQSSLDFANSPNLARGQGTNRGALIEFESSGIRGRIKTEKPTWQAVYETGDAEFQVAFPRQEQLRNAVRSVTIDLTTPMDVVTKRRLFRTIELLRQEGWVETKEGNRIRLTKPGRSVPLIERRVSERRVSVDPRRVMDRTNNYIKTSADLSATIVENVRNEPSNMSIVPGIENPSRSLEVAHGVLGDELITAIHKRADGTFDVGVGGKGSPLESPALRNQFIEEGYFNGQAVSYNGKNYRYQGLSSTPEQASVGVPGSSERINVPVSELRRTPSVKIIEGRPSSIEVLRDILDPEDFAVFRKLSDEVFPEQPQEISLRNRASTNGLIVDRASTGDYIIRDHLSGEEQHRARTEKEAREFVDNSGQAESINYDAEMPIDPDVPGNVMPPPSPGRRVNEPFDFPAQTSLQTMVNAWSATTPFLTPFRSWAAAVDALLGTRILEKVYLPTQETTGRALAAGNPFFKRLQRIETTLNKAGILEARREVVFDYIQKMSESELRGSHREGLGPLRSRSASEGELKSADILIELDVDSIRIYDFIRLRRGLLEAEARKARVEVDQLPEEFVKQLEQQLINDRNMTPNEVTAVAFFEFIKEHDVNNLALDIVTKIADAHRNNTPSQAEFAREMEMTGVELQAARDIEQIYIDVAADPRVPISDDRLIRGYIPHYAEQQTAVPEHSNLNQRGISAERKFVNGMIRSGEINAYDRDPIRTTARYIRAAYNAGEVNPAWNAARKYLREELGQLTGKEGRLARMVTESYLNEVRGIPAHSVQFTQKIFDTVLEKLGMKVEINIRNDVVNTYLAMTNTAFMAGRVGLAARDFTQFMVFHYSRFGRLSGRRTVRALELASKMSAEEKQALIDAGELPTIGPIEFNTPSELLESEVGRPLRGFPSFMRKAADAGLTASGQKNSYEFTYLASFLEARETALREIGRITRDELTKEEAYSNMELQSYDLATQKAFNAFVSDGQYERASTLLGRQTAREIVTEFGKANHPWGWGTNIGRVATQYGTWATNATQFMLRGASQPGTAGLKFAARFAMTQAALHATGTVLGFDLFSWMTLPGLFFLGGPSVQMVGLINDAISGRGIDKDLARARLKQILPNFDDPRSPFLPGSYFLGDILQAIDDADNPVEFFGRGTGIPLKKGRSMLDDLIF